MDRLRFGARSRRREKLKRLTIYAWLLSLAATAAGLPGADTGLRVLGALEKRGTAPGPWSAGDRRHSGTVAGESVTDLAKLRQAIRGERNATPTPPKERPDRKQPDRSRAGGTPQAEEAGAQNAAPAAPGSIADIVYAAAAEYGLSGDYLLSIAECESALDPSAYDGSRYYGLFQFDRTTWAEFGYGDIYDPVAQARTAARLIAAGETSRWPNCA
jgi:hypothetical protein